MDRVGALGVVFTVLWGGSAAQAPHLHQPRDQRLVVRGHPGRKPGASLLQHQALQRWVHVNLLRLLTCASAGLLLFMCMCAVDGGWSRWSPWSRCDKRCGGGRSIRTRSCSSPPPKNGGKKCEGEKNQVKPCNTKPCGELDIAHSRKPAVFQSL